MSRIGTVAVLWLALAGAALGQQPAPNPQPNPGDEKGFVSFAEFSGSANDSGHVLKLDTSAGYNFSRHFGVDVGVPLYFVGGSTTSSTGTSSKFSGSGLGAPYVDARLMFNGGALSYGSSLTAYLPAGDQDKGFSTGRATWDWNNHFDHSFSRFTPFVEAGLGNTVVDTSRFNRPYSSYGYNGHVQGGASLDLTDKFSLGASGYDLLPWGTQTIYSRVVTNGSTGQPAGGGGAGQQAAGSQRHVYSDSAVTTGTADLSKDHGFSAWGDFSPAPYVTAELGYTRSVVFALDTVTFSLRFNLGYLARKSRPTGLRAAQ